MYTVTLDNMMFGGSKPTFAEEFTWCNYTIKYYTIACCGLCGFPLLSLSLGLRVFGVQRFI